MYWGVKRSKRGVSSHLAAQPQRETMHAATWTAKGSEHGVPAFLFCSSSISCSITLITSSVSDCKETVDINYMWTTENAVFLYIYIYLQCSECLRGHFCQYPERLRLFSCLTIDFSCSGFMAGSCCARRQALLKRSKKAVSSAEGSQAGTSQNRSEMILTFALIIMWITQD